MNILTELILKKQMNHYEKKILCLEYEISRKKQEIRKLESKQNELKELISYILSFNEYTIIKEETNKENELFYIVKFDKLEYFYKKFGFEVIFNDIKSQGIIKLKLNKKNL